MNISKDDRVHKGIVEHGTPCYICRTVYTSGRICDECQNKEYRGWDWDCKIVVLQPTGELRQAYDEWYLKDYGAVDFGRPYDLRWGPILKVLRYEKYAPVYQDTTLEITCDNCHEPFTAYFELLRGPEQVTARCTHCSAINSFGVDEIE